MIKPTFELTSENYFSTEASQLFMSNSQMKSFEECETRALASVRGEYKSPSSKALEVGKIGHAWCEGGDDFVDKYINDNFDDLSILGILKKSGDLNAETQRMVDNMIPTMQNDPAFTMCREGDKEVIMTFEFGGIAWKMMIDVHNRPKKRFVDWKFLANIESQWSERGGKQPFIQHWGYDVQMCLYKFGEKQFTGSKDYIDPYVVVMTKQQPSKRIIVNGFNESTMNELLFGDYGVETRIKRVIGVKNGKIEPTSCGQCDHCRRTEKTQFVKWYEL